MPFRSTLGHPSVIFSSAEPSRPFSGSTSDPLAILRPKSSTLFERVSQKPKQLSHRRSVIGNFLSVISPQNELTKMVSMSSMGEIRGGQEIKSRDRKRRNSSADFSSSDPSKTSSLFSGSRHLSFNTRNRPAGISAPPSTSQLSDSSDEEEDGESSSMPRVRFAGVSLLTTATIKLPLDDLDFTQAIRSSLDRIVVSNQKEREAKEHQARLASTGPCFRSTNSLFQIPSPLGFDQTYTLTKTVASCPPQVVKPHRGSYYDQELAALCATWDQSYRFFEETQTMNDIVYEEPQNLDDLQVLEQQQEPPVTLMYEAPSQLVTDTNPYEETEDSPDQNPSLSSVELGEPFVEHRKSSSSSCSSLDFADIIAAGSSEPTLAALITILSESATPSFSDEPPTPALSTGCSSVQSNDHVLSPNSVFESPFLASEPKLASQSPPRPPRSQARINQKSAPIISTPARLLFDTFEEQESTKNIAHPNPRSWVETERSLPLISMIDNESNLDYYPCQNGSTEVNRRVRASAPSPSPGRAAAGAAFAFLTVDEPLPENLIKPRRSESKLRASYMKIKGGKDKEKVDLKETMKKKKGPRRDVAWGARALN